MPALDRHVRHLLDLTDVGGALCADVGCGEGALVRALAALGARATGVEIDAPKVALAAARPRVGHEAYVEGRGEALPFDDESLDLVTFVFSLHHVPVALLDAALDEARRVLRPGGRLHVVDPLATGDMSEVLKPLEDETEVREAAQARAAALDGRGVVLRARTTYEVARSYADVAEYLRDAVAVSPARAARAKSEAGEVAARFGRLARPGPDGRLWLTQPCALFHFEAV